jgi:MscS family membrane protein
MLDSAHRLPMRTAFFLAALLLPHDSRAQEVLEVEASSTEEKPVAAATVDPVLAELLQSPRKTMETFLTAVNEDRLDDAARCLDLSQVAVTEEAKQVKAPEYAYQLKEVIDRMVRVDYDEVDEVSGGQRSELFRLDSIIQEKGFDTTDASRIRIKPNEQGLWLFTADTVAAIDGLYARWQGRPKKQLLAASKARRPPAVWLADQFPGYRETHFLIPDYQLICLSLLIFVGFAADLLTRGVLRVLTRAWFKYHGEELPEQRRVWKPIGLLMQALVWYGGTKLVGLPLFALGVLLIGLKFFTVVAAVWTGFYLIDLLAAVVAKQASRTESKFDDLLVPLISKSLKAIAICVGILTCAQAFELPIAGLLGGLGLGGMAIAFASQDAVSNLFGSITVLLDRPFEVGDWVITEDIEGSVETVGFRSTRIRTFYNSLITLPNSRLTTAVVDNMGRRRFRRVKTTLGIQYDSSPQQIDAFCEGVRELIRRHPYTRKDYYHVYLNDFNASSLDILLYCFLECPDWAVELRERHRLFVDILQLADSLGVSFAFPTRTVHMLEQGLPPQSELGSDALLAGQTSAARISAARSREPLGPVRFDGPTPLEEGP